MNWLLKYNGIEKSFSDWGLSNLTRKRVSQAQDTVSFTCPGPYDVAELFPFGSIITISFQDADDDVTPWFYGRIIQVPREGKGTEENMDYILAGPWWFLDNLVFQQQWKKANPDYDPDDPASPLTILDYKSRVILGQKIDPDTGIATRQTSGEVIGDVIAYAIAAGAPIQLGTIEPDLEIPYDEQNDITCSEAIRRMLRWSPDAVTWFDYSTSPYPTFHCARRSALSSLSLDLLTFTPSHLSLIPRPDIQVPAVVLKFEQINTVNGVDYESTTTQKFPLTATGREFSALTATLQLAGLQMTSVSQKIEVEEIDNIGSTLGQDLFWQKHDETFVATETMVCTVMAGSHKTSDTPYENELKEGQIQDWMSNVHVKEITYTAVGLVTVFDAAGNQIKIETKALSCKIITTDATTKTYTQVTSLVAGEAIPTGLAESLYNSLNPLQYEGKLILTEEECLVGASLVEARAASGRVLNLTGGLAAWATMNALIQQIDEDVDNGITTISFGPPEQLSPQDLMEFLRANRGRAVAFSFKKRETGESASGAGAVELSGPTPLVNTAGASGQTKLLVVQNDANQKINLNPAAIAAITSAVSELKIKEVSVCDNSSTPPRVRYMLTIASELYDK